MYTRCTSVTTELTCELLCGGESVFVLHRLELGRLLPPIASDILKGFPPVRQGRVLWSHLIGWCWGLPLAEGGTWQRLKTAPLRHREVESTHHCPGCPTKVPAQQNGEEPTVCMQIHVCNEDWYSTTYWPIRTCTCLICTTVQYTT